MKGLRYVNYYYADNDNLYLLMGIGNKGSFQVVDLDVNTGETKSTNGNITLDASINDFKVVGGNAYLLGTTVPSTLDKCKQYCFIFTCVPLFTGKVLYKTNAVIINLNLKTGVSTLVRNKYEGDTFIVGTEVNNKENTLNLLIKSLIKKETHIHRNKLDNKGELLSRTKLKLKTDKTINSGKSLSVNKNKEVMIGAYQVVDPKRKNMSSYYATQSSNGIFFCSFENDEQQDIQFYDFSKFPVFYSYLKKTQFSSRDIKKGKDKGENAVSYRLLVHDIIKREKDFLMIAEAYYPQYHTEYYTTYDSNGRPSTSSRRVFDGYRYTHAIIAGFDFQGSLLWDNAFEIGDILSFRLKERVKVLPSKKDNEIVMLYSWGGNISSTVINGDEIVGEKEKTKIESKNDDDKVKDNYNSEVSYWYDNYFVSYGYQTIKSDEEKSKGGKKKRTVFYFNKIVYNDI